MSGLCTIEKTMNKTLSRILVLQLLVYMLVGCTETADFTTQVNPAIDNYQLSLLDPARDNREVKLNVFMPASDSSAYPLLIFSHGFGETYHSYDYLGAALSESGWAVIMINHAGSDADALSGNINEKLSDTNNFIVRPEDIKFVIDLAWSENQLLGGLAGRIDLDNIAVAGHSLGSTSALQTAGANLYLPGHGQPDFFDDRVHAVIAMSPQLGDYTTANPTVAGLYSDSWASITIPTLMLWGSEDRGFGDLTVDPSLRVIAYDNLSSSDKNAVVIEGAEHHAFTETDPWYPGGERDPRHHAWIINLVNDFLMSALNGNTDNQENLLHPVYADNLPWDIQVTSSILPPDADIQPVVDKYTFQITDPARPRLITADLYFPTVDHPRPVILASHCAGCTRQGLTALAERWSRNGFAVIVPDHIDSVNEGGQKGEEAQQSWPDRVADLKFLSENLDQIATQLSLPIESFDPDNIGLAGHYLGTLAVTVAAGGTTISPVKPDGIDPNRIKAILLLSPQGPGQLLDDQTWLPLTQPLMVVTGSNDYSERTGNPPEWRAQVYDLAPGPEKYLGWFGGLDGSYGGLITLDDTAAIESTLSNDLAGVTETFFSAYLLQDNTVFQNITQINNPRFYIE